MTNADPALEKQINLLLQSEKNLYSLKNRLEHILSRLTALQHISQNLIGAKSTQMVLSNVATTITTEMNLEKCLIILKEGSGCSIVAHSGYTLKEKELLLSIEPTKLHALFLAMQSHSEAKLTDTNKESFLDPELANLFSLHIYFSARLTNGTEPIGYIFAGYSKQNSDTFFKQVQINTEDITWFTFLVNQMSAAITNRNLIESLQKKTQDLNMMNADLEKRVEERTEEVKKKVKELEKLNSFMVNRELKMVELKSQISELEHQMATAKL